MVTLAKEYTDTREIKHKVEHLTVSTDDKHHKEQILEELFPALVKPKKHDPPYQGKEINFCQTKSTMRGGVSNGNYSLRPEICRAGKQHQL